MNLQENSRALMNRKLQVLVFSVNIFALQKSEGQQFLLRQLAGSADVALNVSMYYVYALGIVV